jgi:hypothetical protein
VWQGWISYPILKSVESRGLDVPRLWLLSGLVAQKNFGFSPGSNNRNQKLCQAFSSSSFFAKEKWVVTADMAWRNESFYSILLNNLFKDFWRSYVKKGTLSIETLWFSSSFAVCQWTLVWFPGWHSTVSL